MHSFANLSFLQLVLLQHFEERISGGSLEQEQHSGGRCKADLICLHAAPTVSERLRTTGRRFWTLNGSRDEGQAEGPCTCTSTPELLHKLAATSRMHLDSTLIFRRGRESCGINCAVVVLSQA